MTNGRNHRPYPGQRGFYVVISLLMTVLVVIGFWRTLFGPLLNGTLDLAPVFTLHAVVSMGWMVLLVVQASLVLGGRVELHRRVGRFGIGYAALVIAMALWLTFDRFAVRIEAGEFREAHQNLYFPLVDLALFAGFFGAAVLYRRRPETHKRLIIVATLGVLEPAVSRMTFLTSTPLVVTVLLLPVLLGIAFDVVTRRRVHPAYVIGAIVVIASGFGPQLSESDAWFEFSKRVFGQLT